MPREHRCSLELDPSFTSDLERLLAKHAPPGRRGRRIRREFAELVETVLHGIAHDYTMWPEQRWPGEPIHNHELRKARFYFRHFRGKAHPVRIVYLVSLTEPVSGIAVSVYTHAEYDPMIPDTDLEALLDSIFEEGRATGRVPAFLRKLAGDE